MTVTEHIYANKVEVRFKGKLDHTIGLACERAIRHAHALEAEELAINLEGITEVENVSIGTLCFALHTIRQLGMKGSVVHAPNSVKHLLTEINQTAGQL